MILLWTIAAWAALVILASLAYILCKGLKKLHGRDKYVTVRLSDLRAAQDEIKKLRTQVATYQNLLMRYRERKNYQNYVI